jgi:DNA-binding PadR family transcriptional regulator
MHGYELIREYERQEVRDWASVSRPHVYYALKKLASTGHIVGSETRDGARRRSVYKVTSTGSAALADALADPAWAMSQVPSPFTTWLGLSIHARPADARSVVEVRRAFLADQIRKERKTLAAVAADDGARTGIAAVMVGLAISQFETELDWLKRLDSLDSLDRKDASDGGNPSPLAPDDRNEEEIDR